MKDFRFISEFMILSLTQNAELASTDKQSKNVELYIYRVIVCKIIPEFRIFRLTSHRIRKTVMASLIYFQVT